MTNVRPWTPNRRYAVTPEVVERLRALIPCVVCRAPFGEPHDVMCVVPWNREG